VIVKDNFFKNWPYYVGQPLGAAALTSLLFFQGSRLFSGLINLSLGSSIFTLAVFPHQPQSAPRNLLGGYFCGALVGLLFAALKHFWPGVPVHFWIAGVVFLAIFLILIVHSRHAPGTSLALGVFFSPRPLAVSALAIINISAVCLAKELTKRWLKDLA
jgi:CBS-domain-containing membrane protein